MTDALRRGRWLRVATAAVSVVGISWVVWRFVAGIGELPATHGIDLILAVGSGSVLYAVLTLLLVLAWRWLLGAYDRRPRPRTAYSVWARSQIAKYLPGNVLHLASRHVLGRDCGLSHPGLVFAGVFESASLAIAALTIAALRATGARAGFLSPWIVGLAVLGVALGWPLAERALRGFRPTIALMTPLPPLGAREMLRLLLPAWALHLAFLSGTGLLLLGVLRSLSPEQGVPASTVVASFAVAWLGGFLVPGAPGGLGVREALLVLQLTPTAGAATASAAALLLRGITLLGDLETALLGWLAETTQRARSTTRQPTPRMRGEAGRSLDGLTRRD